MSTFADFFRAATGNDPYPYQSEFATRNALPALLSVFTGCGKGVLLPLPTACCQLALGSHRVRQDRGSHPGMVVRVTVRRRINPGIVKAGAEAAADWVPRGRVGAGASEAAITITVTNRVMITITNTAGGVSSR